MIYIYTNIFIYFSFALAILYFIGWNLSKFKTQKKLRNSSSKFYDNASISLVVAFRNEANNLPTLLESISKLSLKPKEIIFVNDHSNDNSIGIIEQFELDFPKSLIHLDENQLGKKQALRKGIEHSSGEYILTWDADILVKPNYFVALEEVKISDLLLLPVKMKGKNLLSFFAELDFYYINNLNVSTFGIHKAILSNGANMLFKKHDFLEHDSYERHKKITSGDDVFILSDFKKQKKSIHLSLDKNLVVETKAPRTFNELIHQRLRWIKKTNLVADNFANFIGLIGLFYHLGFILLFLLLDFNIWVLVLKIVFDCLIFTPYLLKIKRFLLVVLVPAFSLIYPLYIVFIGFSSLFVKPNWKDRIV